MPPAESVLRDALTQPLAGLGVDVEEVDVSRAGRRQVVRVVIDRDGGVDLDVVADVSRRVSEILDTGDLATVLTGPYVLEVTSPGVDRPLTEQRHWRRAVGRLVHLDSVDGSVVEGRIIEVPDDISVVVAVGSEERVIDRSTVRRAVVQVEFQPVGKPPAVPDHDVPRIDASDTDASENEEQ